MLIKGLREIKALFRLYFSFMLHKCTVIIIIIILGKKIHNKFDHNAK